jgi:hypothetical protein
LAVAVVAGASCLLLYACLPLRAAARPAINWGDPATPAAWLDHVRGGEFVKFRMLQAQPGIPFTGASYASFASRISAQVASDFVDQLVPVAKRAVFDPSVARLFRPAESFAPAGAPPDSDGIEALFRPFLVVLLVLAVAGAGIWARRDARFFAAATLAATANTAVVYLYNIADVTDYYLLPMWFAWVCVFAGALWLAGLAARGRVARVPSEAAWLLLAVPLAVGAGNFGRCDRSRDSDAETLSYTILPESRERMPEGAVLVTAGDADIYTSWYRQVVRGERRDVLVFGSNFGNKPWYRAFFTDAQVARHGLRFGTRTPVGAEAFVRGLAEGVLDSNVGKFPVYTTIDDPAVLRLLS